MNKDDIQMVNDLESQYDQLLPHLHSLSEALDKIKEVYPSYQALREFYASPEWLRLNQVDTSNIKAGILSQDTLYDLIIDHNNILEKMMDLSARMYKQR